MRNLFCIVGPTGAGKDELTKQLCASLNLKAVTSYTNRPMREDETEGIEHYFRNRSQMKKILEDEEVVAYTKIEDPNSGVEGYEYCTTKQELEQSDVYCIDPNGIQYLKSKVTDVNLVVIYIATKYEIRRQRVASSGRGNKELILKQFDDRVNNEKAQFERFLLDEEYDYIVDNNANLPNMAFDALLNIVNMYINGKANVPYSKDTCDWRYNAAVTADTYCSEKCDMPCPYKKDNESPCIDCAVKNCDEENCEALKVYNLGI